MEAKILEPIPGPNPSGTDLRYEAEYSDIYERVRRARGDLLHHLVDSQAQNPNLEWRDVVTACNRLLIWRTKDLRIAAWLAEAQFAVDGFSGLRDGLEILAALISTFWDTLFPEQDELDDEVRKAVLEHASHQLAVAVRSSEGGSRLPSLKATIFELKSCRAALDSLITICDDRIGDGQFIFRELQDALSKYLKSSIADLVADAVAEYPAAMDSEAVANFPGDDQLEDLLRQLVKPEMQASTVLDQIVGEGRPTPTAPQTSAPDIPQASSSDYMAQEPRFSTPAFGKVDFTLTAPAFVTAAVPFELFVWAHWPQERYRVLSRAREELMTRDVVARTKGPFRVATGTPLTVRLRILGAVIDEPLDSMTWEGESTCVSFVVTLPELNPQIRCSGSAYIYADGVQIAKIPFLLSAAGKPGGMLAASPVRYSTAFASYATADRDQVMGRIQGIRKAAPELDIFVDVLSLRSGQNWEQELWRVIPASDIFYLFWSAQARKSEWVEKEWRCALRERGIGFIDPIPLESPEEAPPPPELSSLHFNDWLLAFRSRSAGN